MTGSISHHLIVPFLRLRSGGEMKNNTVICFRSIAIRSLKLIVPMSRMPSGK